LNAKNRGSKLKQFIVIAGISGFLAVALGAFGAHFIKNRLTEEMFAIYQTGVQYHFYHTLALLGVGVLAYWMPDVAALKWSGWLFVCGIVIFSGSLYALSLSGIRVLGAVTPIGGLAFLAGWVMLIIAALKQS